MVFVVQFLILVVTVVTVSSSVVTVRVVHNGAQD